MFLELLEEFFSCRTTSRGIFILVELQGGNLFVKYEIQNDIFLILLYHFNIFKKNNKNKKNCYNLDV